jgi:hypothetical protein
MKTIIINENQMKRILKHLKEQASYSNNVEIKNSSDYEITQRDLVSKLDIINKYFPFESVDGYYDEEEGLDLTFDNGIKIYGKFSGEPFIVDFISNDFSYEIDIHPFGVMGELDANVFEENIKSIYISENKISIVITNEDGWAEGSITIDKDQLAGWRIVLVEGEQIKGKLVGKTQYGEGKVINEYKLIY